MNEFFDIKITSDNKEFVFSKADGSQTSLVILDDGWTPAVATYNNENIVEDVVEELYCMTNVASRDEALTLINDLNNVIHYAKTKTLENFEYSVTFYVKSQFSMQSNASYTYIIGPSGDNEVIQLSNELMTASPGQIKFKLRFKRKGFWILDNDYKQKVIELNADSNGFKGIWYGADYLLNSIETPTPISIDTNFIATTDNDVFIERLFLCINVELVEVLKIFYWDTSFNMSSITYNQNLHAQNNTGYLIQDNTNTVETRPYGFILLPPGTYAVFVFWRSVQSNVVHKVQVQFDTNAELKPVVLLANDTNPKVTNLGTVTLYSLNTAVYLQTQIGDSNGFEIEKLVFIRLNNFSKIIEIYDTIRKAYETLYLNNKLESLYKTLLFYKKLVSVYDNLNTIAHHSLIKLTYVGNSPGAFSLKNIDGRHVYKLETLTYYKNIKTVFH